LIFFIAEHFANDFRAQSIAKKLIDDFADGVLKLDRLLSLFSRQHLVALRVCVSQPDKHVSFKVSLTESAKSAVAHDTKIQMNVAIHIFETA